jgi:hypothetical protein
MCFRALAGGRQAKRSHFLIFENKSFFIQKSFIFIFRTSSGLCLGGRILLSILFLPKPLFL